MPSYLTVFAVNTEKYSNSSAQDMIIAQGSSVTVNYPNSLYLTIVSGNDVGIGYFTINY